MGLELLLIAAALAGTSGFRGDGTGRYPDADPPAAPTELLWRHPTAAWSNASPVRFGPLLCVMEEPTTLTCLDAATGALRWQRPLDVLDAVPAAERATLAARLQALPSLQQQRRDAARALSLARRASHGAETSGPTVAESTAELARIQEQIDALAPYTTPPDKDLVGYSSPTPLARDDRIYALTGHGVLAAFDLQGSRQWSVWLGPAPGSMRGFDFGQSASPVWAGGLLIVGHDHLRALDPRTGAVRWHGPSYRDYGTPAVVRVGGKEALATPDGLLLDATTGRTLASGLGDLWYTGPVVQSDRLYYIGGHGNERQEGLVTAKAWRVVVKAEALAVEPLWSVDLGLRTRLYGTPVWAEERLWFVTRTRDLVVLDARTGQIAHREVLSGMDTEAWAGPVWGGGRLIITTRGGGWLSGEAKLPFVGMQHRLGEELRSTPWLEGERVCVRTVEAVSCFGR
jgi:outer membrane protein assembly factor BamB